MKRQTKLMSKLLGDSASKEFQQKVFSKIDEAREKGFSTLDEDGELLQFAEVDDDIIVEDQANGNELTRISENPENENDLVLSEEVIPTEAPTEAPSAEPTQAPTEETKTESENLESIEIERIPGPDGEKAEDIVPDLKIDIIPGIGTENKPNATYSMKFKNYSESKAKKVAKLFSECVGCIEGIVKDADVDEDVKVKFVGDEEMKVMSVKIGKGTRTFSEGDETEDLTEVIDDANALAETAESGINAENAGEIREECDKVMSKIDAVEAKGIKLYSIKSLVKKFSEEAAEVLDAEPTQEPTAEPSAEPTAEPTQEPSAEPTAEPTAEPSAEPTAEPTQAAEEEPVAQCEETGKWFVKKDDNKTLYDSKEEAVEAAKNFSEPTVTVTIENLEPASVSTLLAGPSGDEGKEEPTSPVAPAVNPNEGEQGRQFSVKGKEDYSNPLLHTQW